MGVSSTGNPSASLTHFIVIRNAVKNQELAENTKFFVALKITMPTEAVPDRQTGLLSMWPRP
jgi:hypothetical protein